MVVFVSFENRLKIMYFAYLNNLSSIKTTFIRAICTNVLMKEMRAKRYVLLTHLGFEAYELVWNLFNLIMRVYSKEYNFVLSVYMATIMWCDTCHQQSRIVIFSCLSLTERQISFYCFLVWYRWIYIYFSALYSASISL